MKPAQPNDVDAVPSWKRCCRRCGRQDRHGSRMPGLLEHAQHNVVQAIGAHHRPPEDHVDGSTGYDLAMRRSWRAEGLDRARRSQGEPKHASQRKSPIHLILTPAPEPRAVSSLPGDRPPLPVVPADDECNPTDEGLVATPPTIEPGGGSSRGKSLAHRSSRRSHQGDGDLTFPRRYEGRMPIAPCLERPSALLLVELQEPSTLHDGGAGRLRTHGNACR